MDDRIFSGEDSEQLWAAICRVKDPIANNALYLLACKCQQLEDRLRKSAAATVSDQGAEE